MSYHKIDNKYYGYIYIIYNTINKKVYIGQTRRTVGIRWQQHLDELNTGRNDNPALYNAMRKYGSGQFYVQTIKEYSFATKQELITVLNQEEIKYISKYNSITPNGYNIQRGGKSSTDSVKRPVDKYSLDGVLIKSYDSILDACADEDEQKELNRIHISECCRGMLYTSGGYVWRFCGEPFDKYKVKDKRTRAVDKYSKLGIFIKHYETFSEAVVDTFNVHNTHKYQSHISSCCQGKRKTAYGYIWRYSEDSSNEYDGCLNAC